MLLAEDGDTIWKFTTFTNKDDAFDATMKFKKQIPYVTHQLALKWLREVHKINIVIGVASDDDNLYSLWKFDIWNGNYSIIWGDKRKKFNSYEQAVEAALKYTLENLI